MVLEKLWYSHQNHTKCGKQFPTEIIEHYSQKKETRMFSVENKEYITLYYILRRLQKVQTRPRNDTGHQHYLQRKR